MTPGELARELHISPRRIRAVLRSELGLLPTEDSRWRLDQDQVDFVHSRFRAYPPEEDAEAGQEGETRRPTSAAESADATLGQSSVPELLEMYASILTELKSRNVIRTGNAPLGDYAEFLAQKVYGGVLAPNSSKSYDVTSDDGRLIQVKARAFGEKTSGSAVFSVFRSFEFDVATLLVFDAGSYDLLWAREVSPGDVESSSRWSEHVNGRLLRMAVAKSLGVDVTQTFLDAIRVLEKNFRA